MIPINYITQWQRYAPWAFQSQVEQDLVLSRALVSLYQQPVIQDSLAFRGGTALNKLYCDSSARYSEDIDLVQIKDAPIGSVMTAIREVLDPWLGQARWKQSARLVKLIYRFQSEEQPSIPLRLKIEINTVEPFSVLGFQGKSYEVSNEWFSGKANIRTYGLDELMATKFRALYQRSKGRDLYDLWMALTQLGAVPNNIVKAFNHYNKFHQVNISRAEYERNFALKMQDIDFLSDAGKVLPADSIWEPQLAFDLISKELIEKLHGAPWKGLIEKNDEM